MTKKKKISFEAQAARQIKDEAHRIAAGIKITGQTREQTKLIAKGIEKGIALYKKQEAAKTRMRNKMQRSSPTSENSPAKPESETQNPSAQRTTKQAATALITGGVIFLLVSAALAGWQLADIAIYVGDYEIPALWSLLTALTCLALASWMFLTARTFFRSR